MREYKSPAIHRTPPYRAKAAYVNMKNRCGNHNGKNQSYAGVELRMTLDQWMAWAVPKYEAFDQEYPGEVPNISRHGDLGHYEIGNIELTSRTKNLAEMIEHRGILLLRSDGTKLCGRCRDVKDSGLFNKNRSRPDGFSATCKKCHRETCSTGW